MVGYVCGCLFWQQATQRMEQLYCWKPLESRNIKRNITLQIKFWMRQLVCTTLKGLHHYTESFGVCPMGIMIWLHAAVHWIYDFLGSASCGHVVRIKPKVNSYCMVPFILWCIIFSYHLTNVRLGRDWFDKWQYLHFIVNFNTKINVSRSYRFRIAHFLNEK